MSAVVYPSPGYPVQAGYSQYTDPNAAESMFNDELFQSFWFWILVLLVIAALAIAIGVLVWIGTREDTFVDTNLSIQQTSTATLASDTFQTNKYDLYLGKNTVTLNLNIPANDSNVRGRELFIKNDGSASINLDTRSLVNFNEGRITNGSTVESGAYAVFTFESSNSLLRLQ